MPCSKGTVWEPKKSSANKNHAHTKKSNHFRTNLSPFVHNQHQPTHDHPDPPPSLMWTSGTSGTSATSVASGTSASNFSKPQHVARVLTYIYLRRLHVSYFKKGVPCNTMQYHAIASYLYTESRLFKDPVTVEIRSVAFPNLFACSLLTMNLCEHTRALSGYPLQKWSCIRSCYVMLGYVLLSATLSIVVKRCRLLQTRKNLGA